MDVQAHAVYSPSADALTVDTLYPWASVDWESGRTAIHVTAYTCPPSHTSHACHRPSAASTCTTQDGKRRDTQRHQRPDHWAHSDARMLGSVTEPSAQVVRTVLACWQRDRRTSCALQNTSTHEIERLVHILLYSELGVLNALRSTHRSGARRRGPHRVLPHGGDDIGRLELDAQQNGAMSIAHRCLAVHGATGCPIRPSRLLYFFYPQRDKRRQERLGFTVCGANLRSVTQRAGRSPAGSWP